MHHANKKQSEFHSAFFNVSSTMVFGNIMLSLLLYWLSFNIFDRKSKCEQYKFL